MPEEEKGKIGDGRRVSAGAHKKFRIGRPRGRMRALSDEDMERLGNLEDRKLVTRASQGPGGEVFSSLFLGEDICGNEKRSRQALMNRLAFWCSGDEKRMVRIYTASGFGDGNEERTKGLAARALAETPERLKPDTAQKFKGEKAKTKEGESFK